MPENQQSSQLLTQHHIMSHGDCITTRANEYVQSRAMLFLKSAPQKAIRLVVLQH